MTSPSFNRIKLQVLCKALVDNKKELAWNLIPEVPTTLLNSIDERYQRTPLQLAILIQDLKLISSLIDNGANPEFKSPDGRDAYDFAILMQNPKIVSIVSNQHNCVFCSIL